MGVFAKIQGFSYFLELWNYFSKEKAMESVHDFMDRVHNTGAQVHMTSLNECRRLADQGLRLSRSKGYNGF
jgi:hypothetical protein